MNGHAFHQELKLEDRERWRSELASVPDFGSNRNGAALLAFYCAGEAFACRPGIVESITRLPKVHSLPASDPAIAGFVNARGHVLLCFSLADVLDCKGSGSTDPMMLVLNDRNWRVAVRIDRVHGLVESTEGNPSDLPATLRATGHLHTTGFVEVNAVRFAVVDSARLFETLREIARSCLTT